VSPVKYELGLYIPEDDIIHSHCRENLKSYTFPSVVISFPNIHPMGILFRKEKNVAQSFQYYLYIKIPVNHQPNHTRSGVFTEVERPQQAPSQSFRMVYNISVTSPLIFMFMSL
jgi:hypothetical protein